MHEILRTDRLRLRHFEPSDADNLVTLYGDHEVMQYIDAGIWDHDRIEAEVLPGLLAEYTRYQKYGYWAVETHSGSFVGRIGLHPVIMSTSPDEMWQHAPDDDSDVVSIGYRLCRRHWGHGYATEATRAVLSLAFACYGVSRAVATTMAVNHRSRRVLERLGFQYARTLYLDWADPLPGAELGDVIYELRCWCAGAAISTPDR
jgi:RimJ/RimL family protein N-acetyltransferase